MDEKRGRLSKRVRERERERERERRDREKDEESMRIGEGRKSSGKTDVPKLHAYNECEHPVYWTNFQSGLLLEMVRGPKKKLAQFPYECKL